MKKNSDLNSKSQVKSRITGWGFNVPPRIVTNDYFASYLETNDQWIRERTGIIERRWIEGNVSASELAEPACRRAIEKAGLNIQDIDGVVFATVTPDHLFPSSACCLQKRLGLKNGFAFDINAVCSGFVYSLAVADSMLARGQAKHILVVGADIFSRLIDPQDRTTCVLFGDGAGAVVLSATSDDGDFRTARGIYGSQLRADGNAGELLCVPMGTACPASPETLNAGKQYVKMAGREIFKLAVRWLSDVSTSLLAEVGLELADVDYILSHQANQRILSAMANQLKVPEEKVLSNVSRYGNTSAASVPILLAESAEQNKIKSGDLLLLNAVGGGLTWGAVLLRL